MLTERTRQQNHEHIINKGINISINSKYFCDFTDCFCDFSHIVCDFSDYFRDFSAKLPSRPLICVNPYFSDYFCDFSKNFCDFCKNFCDFSKNFCDYFCDFSKNLCDFSDYFYNFSQFFFVILVLRSVTVPVIIFVTLVIIL
ncbi:hypothetical protein RND81_08G134200 [Saponaria officinalis]|uniref:Uncharacterized protein n=1 Tax=Saponaria officinalis TaxID=3572 RepID=A0AAW1JAH6_SAPOF